MLIKPISNIHKLNIMQNTPNQMTTKNSTTSSTNKIQTKTKTKLGTKTLKIKAHTSL